MKLRFNFYLLLFFGTAIFNFMLVCVDTKIANAENVDISKLKSEFQELLDKYPELILDFLEKHSEKVLDIAQQGAGDKKKRLLFEQWEKDAKVIKSPKIVDRPMKGDQKAETTLIAFSDFTCPFCQKAFFIVEDFLVKNPQVRYIFKHYPLENPSNSRLASEYFIAAAKQDEKKAWALYADFFQDAAKLQQEGEPFISSIAKKHGLNIEKLKEDIKNKEVQTILQEDIEDGNKLGLQGTPYFLMDNLVIIGAPTFDILKEALLKAKEVKK